MNAKSQEVIDLPLLCLNYSLIQNPSHMSNRSSLHPSSYHPRLEIQVAITALYNCIAYGADADATNAFAEAPTPKAPLYVTIDALFKAWWEQVLKLPSITVGHFLPVRHNLQGYLESLHLWAQMINDIITGPTMNFNSTAHDHACTMEPLKTLQFSSFYVHSSTCYPRKRNGFLV